jgi:hypothetical protein
VNSKEFRELIINDLTVMDLDNYSAIFCINDVMTQLSRLSQLIGEEIFTDNKGE